MPKNKLDTFKNYLGYDGNKVNEAKALAVLEEIGVGAVNDGAFLKGTDFAAAYNERRTENNA
ncbi:hypothetical protein SAMN04488128_101449 [Chitinophaga eiseniae]|uniref:Uncharacterized protein n=1 Tax=Chitinophaga eiseniae TaxID=634771 RepID=A0A1T4L355_9BACT|nr:hypothetical protein [Chitinophaga eiseniae]SJZ49018.1 hypothetical protein SAMN04488128_101449 [Chitinophaga eiseniae]